MAKHEGALGAVYEARGAEEIAKLYDGWASSYDEEMAKAGYRHPTIGLALLSRHLPKGSGPILDAGAGTGLIGEWLTIMGFGPIDALDISPGMLAVARAKNVYATLHQAALGGPLNFADAAFAGIISVGVFTTGHVGAEGLDELVRICRKGGIIVLTVKNTVWENGFAVRIAELSRGGVISVVEETVPYVSMPGEVGTTPSRALAIKIL